MMAAGCPVDRSSRRPHPLRDHAADTGCVEGRGGAANARALSSTIQKRARKFSPARIQLLFNELPGHDHASGEMQSSLRLLFGAVGFLLLIACANVANLQMARATARSREIALRMSIGATRARILRQLLTESVVLSIAGGALGIFFAIGITQAVVALMPEFYVPNEARITVNNYVLLFSLAVSMSTAFLLGWSRPCNARARIWSRR